MKMLSGVKPYDIDFLEDVVEKDLAALPVTIESRVSKAIQTRLRINPNKLGKPLSYKLKGYFSLRVGDYRIIYRIETLEHKVLITAIGHRKEIYKRCQE